jgi:hypothetical protein
MTVLRDRPDASATSVLPPPPQRMGYRARNDAALDLTLVRHHRLEELTKLLDGRLHNPTTSRDLSCGGPQYLPTCRRHYNPRR